jgi:hypothetical protein
MLAAMVSILSVVVAASLVMLFVGIVAYNAAYFMLMYRLRNYHRTHYDALQGPPALFVNRSRRSWEQVRYIIDKDYLALDDARASALGNRARQFFFVALCAFATSIVGWIALGFMMR